MLNPEEFTHAGLGGGSLGERGASQPCMVMGHGDGDHQQEPYA